MYCLLTDVHGRRWPQFPDWLEDDGWVFLPPNYWGYTSGFKGAVLDVGAHVGGCAIPMAVAGRRVFAVEASPRNMRSLLASAEINGCRALVTPMPYAAWREDGDVPWFESDQTGSRVLGEGPNTVPAIRLSEDRFPERIGLVKLDVEGVEPEVLRGMASLIARDRPFIALEDHSRHPHLVADPEAYRAAILLPGYEWTVIDPFSNGCVQWLGKPHDPTPPSS